MNEKLKRVERLGQPFLFFLMVQEFFCISDFANQDSVH